MSLVPDYENSSNSSSNSESENSTHSNPPEVTQKPKLPPPNFMGLLHQDEIPKSSVFKNQFLEAENAKEAVLQKHVKMVETKDNVNVINGRKICWNYRKGKCRFGHNCKFAHDSDIQKNKGSPVKTMKKVVETQEAVVCKKQLIAVQAQPTSDDLEAIQLEEASKTQKRKRTGLTQGLVPGKKVMRNYMKQKK